MRRPWSSLLALGLVAFEVHGQGEDHIKLQNSNHIFNAIRGSMRQWDTSILHNGMSFFISTVPEGAQLYHGTNSPDRINGTEWLAFEPEHALVFARGHRGPPPGKGGPPRPEDEHHDGRWHPDGDGWHPPERLEYDADHFDEMPKPDMKARHPHEEPPLTHTMAQRARAEPANRQKPMRAPDGPPDEDAHGYLHTYRAKHDLRLLYLDGQSAAKSNKGTLDTQDVVLLHEKPPPKNSDEHPPLRKDEKKGRRPGPGGPMSEGYRAEEMCKMAANEWKGRVDGFLRMELGFEIILCSFEDDLDVERITQTNGGGMGGPPGHGDDGDSLNYYKAVASRFDSIGGDRVRINYDNFVTLFSHDESIYFDEGGFPRARNETAALKRVRSAISKMVLQEDEGSTDWQAIADMVISRYADRIENLAAGQFDSLEAFKSEVVRAVRPFIDYGARNFSAEVERCTTQYFPSLPPPDNLAAESILQVTTSLCSALFSAERQHTFSDALAIVRALKVWLGWPVWKRCRGCSYNEVCFVPIWPMGSEEDMEHPRCVSNMSSTGRGYWGRMGGPGGPPDHKRADW